MVKTIGDLGVAFRLCFKASAIARRFSPMETSFINMPMLVHLHVNQTNFQMKDFALGLALKQRRKATRLLSVIVGIVWRS